MRSLHRVVKSRSKALPKIRARTSSKNPLQEWWLSRCHAERARRVVSSTWVSLPWIFLGIVSLCSCGRHGLLYLVLPGPEGATVALVLRFNHFKHTFNRRLGGDCSLDLPWQVNIGHIPSVCEVIGLQKRCELHSRGNLSWMDSKNRSAAVFPF